MIDPDNVPDVESDETLARYIVQSSHIRFSNKTIKQDAFVPHPHRDLSVTRHLLASEVEVWSVGEDVASASGKTLYGRGDVGATTCLARNLILTASPTLTNPNHADVSDWPADKPAQKIIAQEIAAAAKFVSKP